MPVDFPIPVFRPSTEDNLSKKRLADDDRKYIVRVLATILTTYTQRPRMKDCEIPAQALVRKYSFLKESVSYEIGNLVISNSHTLYLTTMWGGSILYNSVVCKVIFSSIILLSGINLLTEVTLARRYHCLIRPRSIHDKA